MIPPILYFGSKSRIASHITELMVEQCLYVEVFGGSGSVLFSKKPPATLDLPEVYNDLNKDLFSLMRVLANPDVFEEFARRVNICPYSYAECQEANQMLDRNDISLVDRAVYTFIAYNQGFAGKRHAWGKVTSIYTSPAYLRYWSKV